jgi:protein involved in polysaccharide export with SLBB domain
MRGKLPSALFVVSLLANAALGADFRGGAQALPPTDPGIPPLRYTVPENVLNEMKRRGMEPPLDRQLKEPLPQPPPQFPLLPEEPPSDFELFVSGKIEIRESQLEHIRKSPSISFFPYHSAVPMGMIEVPVRILKDPVKGEPAKGEPAVLLPEGAESIGFLVGTVDDIADMFRLLGIKSSHSVNTDLRQFGYDLFSAPASTFAPADKVPVGPDYVIGPGDELRVAVWGKVDGQFDLTVDRDGQVAIPKVGVIGLSGLTFREAKEAISREFSKYYTGFEMNVVLGALRSIQVYVVGNARRPGAYTVSSLSTVVNVLFAAGGPSKAGSMRDIQVKRGDKTVTRLDMYDLLQKGEKGNDIRVMPEDVIYIPPIGPVIAIAGSVNVPAIYELKGDTTLRQGIRIAGGPSPLAFRGRARIERIADSSRQMVFESDLASAQGLDVPLQPGDIVTIFPVVRDKRVVRIAGAVQREGDYGASAGMTVKDLVSLSGGLTYYAYRREAELTRFELTPEGPKSRKIAVDLEAALEGDPGKNLALQENDYLFVRAVPEWRPKDKVTVSGEVLYPGVYTIHKGEKVSSLLERAGGFTDRAYLKGAVFTRERVRELSQRQIEEMADRLERELASSTVEQATALLSGEEAKIKQLEFQQKQAFLKTVRQAKAKGRIVISLQSPEKLRNTRDDFELEAGDTLTVPLNPGTVQVAGAVFNQTAFLYQGPRGIKGYVDSAGGYTENADSKRLYVLKVDGSAVRPQGGMFLFGADEVALDPGDTIVVPEKLDRIAWIREVKDITQILFQIATAAGVIVALF